MKHIFYVIYITSYSAAVLVAGMLVGQVLERFWSRREAEARLKSRSPQMESAGEYENCPIVLPHDSKVL